MDQILKFASGTGALALYTAIVAGAMAQHLVLKDNKAIPLDKALMYGFTGVGTLVVAKAALYGVAFGGDVLDFSASNDAIAGILTNPHTLKHLGALAYQGLYIP